MSCLSVDCKNRIQGHRTVSFDSEVKYRQFVSLNEVCHANFVPYDFVFVQMESIKGDGKYKITAKSFLTSRKMNFILVFLIFSADSLIITKRAKPRTGNDGIFGNHDDDDHNLGELLI